MKDIISVVVTQICPVAATIFSAWSILVTRKGNKKNIESNEKISQQVQDAEDKRIEAQIDANIVWNARVEWIQNVRRVTADFITACYKYVQTDKRNVEEQKKNLDLIQQNKTLLILYFGPDTKNVIGHQDILNQESNEAKNNEIVTLINTIFEQAKDYFFNKERLDKCIDDLNECNTCQESCYHAQMYLCGIQKEQDKCHNVMERLDEIIEEYERDNKEFLHNIGLLSEAMRIYLKLEWNKAKNRDSI